MLVNKTPLHPDVQDIRGRIADFERQVASTPRFAAEPPTNNSSRGLIFPPQVKSSPLINEKENREINSRKNLAAADQNQSAETLKQLQHAAEHLTENGILIVEIGHNRDVLEAAYPKLPFTWLDVTAGDQFVFMLHRNDLL